MFPRLLLQLSTPRGAVEAQLACIRGLDTFVGILSVNGGDRASVIGLTGGVCFDVGVFLRRRWLSTAVAS